MNEPTTEQSYAPGAADRAAQDELIAVTALDCRFPGAPDTEAFWDLLVAGRSGLTRHTEQELAEGGLPGRLRRSPAHVPVSGVIEGQDLFDPEPFGLTDAEAALMDPQQRLFLEACLRALERAGHGGGAGAGAVGVFAGSAHSDYLTRNLARRYADSAADPVGSLQAAISGVGDYLPLHVAHRLALTGPALAVGTACSTSLVAVHLAAQSLLAGECDTALAGGSSLIVPQGRGYLHVPDGIFSVDGQVRTFSAEGTGIVHSQGVGVTVLRRLADALADGDPVLAVLHGSAVNNDGADRTGFTAPSPRGQARAISEALALAGVTPDMVSYVEAHGTATRLGDVVELAALKTVFGQNGPAWCALGSVKSNIGHANAAAGIAGFAKTVLALHHGVLPASLGALPLNPDLDLENSPFTVPHQAGEWAGLRHAGVSSFGIGGTNCHVVLGSAPRRAVASADRRPQLALFSAHRDDALERLADATAAALEQPGADAADAAYTLHTGRSERSHRAAAIIGDRPGDTLRAFTSAPRRTVPPTRPRVVLAFPGGGAQYPGMGRELLDDEPEFARTVAECAALFDARGDGRGSGLGALLAAAPSDESAGRLLRDPVYGLPALFTVSLATARTLRSWGIEPDALVGHSLGEYAAAVAAGALRLSDAATLVDVRSRGMSRTAGGGVMLSVALPEDETVKLLGDHPDLDLAAVNAPRSCVVSGPVAAVVALERDLTADGVHSARLHLDAAAHSRLVDPVLPELRAAAEATLPGTPAVPLATTLTGQLLLSPPGADHWVPHLRSVVRFSDALTTALGTGPAVVVQVGPGSGLLQLVRQHGAANVVATLPTFPGREDSRGARAALLTAAGELWTHGVSLDPEAIHRPGRRRIALPGLPFERRRLWIDPPEETRPGAPMPYAPAEPDEEEPFQVPVWHRTPPVDAFGRLEGRWLVDGYADSPLLSAVREELTAAGAHPVTLAEAAAEPALPCAGIVMVDAEGADGDGVDVPADAGHGADARVEGADGEAAKGDTGHERAYQADLSDRAELSDRAAASELAGREATAGLSARAASADPARRVADSVLGYSRVAQAAAPWAATACLLHVSAGAQHVESADRPAPDGAAGLAVPRVLAQEFPGLRWRTLDLPAGPVRAQDVRSVCEEAAALTGGGPSGLEAAYRGGHRWVRGITPWQPPEPEPELRGDTAVVIGGLGDVGLALAAHLARGSWRVVVTGRDGLPADPVPGSPSAERAEAVRRLREDGIELDVRAVDAADPDATAALLREVAQQYGPLGLIVHAAGVVASAAVTPLRAVAEETVRDHARAKVTGAMALRSALRGLPDELRPAHVLLMSSATTFVGGLGLAPYAAANRFLDALAEREDAERAGGTRWVSVAWDGWRIGSGGTERVVASRHSIGLRDGMRSVDRLLALAGQGRAPASLAVSPADLAARTAGTATVVPGRRETADGTPGQGAPALQGVAEELLAGLWSELLGFPVADRDADFFALGGHSLLATRMLARLRDERGVVLRLQDLLARPTVAALAQLMPVSSAAPPGSGTRIEETAPVDAGEQPVADSGEFPLTRVQHAYWVGGSGGYRLGDVPCSFHLEYDCPGLDTARYEEAWNRVIARHPMLRAVISPEGRNRVLDRVPRYRIRVQDLTGQSEDQRARKLEQIRARLVRREPRPGRWPLVDIRAARLPGDIVRLFVNVDVLVCDTASYLIWDRELRALYEKPEHQLPPVRTTFEECVAALERRAGSPERARAAAYWRARIDALPGAPALPLSTAQGEERPRFGRRSAQLEPGDWASLKAEAARRGLTPTAVLLAAYGDALADWSGQDRFSLTLTLFDRPSGLPGADEVVGDFTSLMLHTVDRSSENSFASAAARAQRTLFEDLDHREFSALELLAEKSVRTGRTESVPVVFTSALGLSGPLGGGHDLDWVGTPVHGVSSTPQTWLDHQVLEQHGALLLQWDVLESELSADEADRVFAEYVAHLRRLARGEAAWEELREPKTGAADPAAHARGAGGGADVDAALLLREGNSDRPLFLIHPSGGDVLCYGELAGLLTDGRPVVALTDPALTGGVGAQDIAGMADQYLAAIRSYQSGGPYLLGGWSMGGTLAHAMACELERRGERTDLLVMIDSNVPDRIRSLGGAGPDEDRAIAAVRYLRSLEAFLDMDLGLGEDEARRLLAKPSPDARSAVAARLREAGLVGPRETADVRLETFERHLRALGDHQAGQLASSDTRLLLFRAAQPSPSNAGVGMGVDDAPDLDCLGWRPHVPGPVEEVSVDGHHYSLLTGPAAARIAALTDRALAAVTAGRHQRR
ncbi:type I polyketide synthase [Streptomyces sp. BA2]|uniref:type I polyketide synthase n=1 Tax=Streptomyces sp. BA2 TaxID=436595 RepID=UPI001320C7BE|nr:type I polyketide synthase [Streptomyces sp. BA2]MWA16230.1 SDR family NAD(P)-dependent oxidoreductase [Streptomyces sp. BA2]